VVFYLLLCIRSDFANRRRGRTENIMNEITVLISGSRIDYQEDFILVMEGALAKKYPDFCVDVSVGDHASCSLMNGEEDQGLSDFVQKVWDNF